MILAEPRRESCRLFIAGVEAARRLLKILIFDHLKRTCIREENCTDESSFESIGFQKNKKEKGMIGGILTVFITSFVSVDSCSTWSIDLWPFIGGYFKPKGIFMN